MQAAIIAADQETNLLKEEIDDSDLLNAVGN